MLEADRGSLPFALIHGEALVACAAWALGESGVTPVDDSTPWAALVEAGEPLLLHDALCPMAPPEFLATCLALAVESDSVVVAVRPVTDTVKRLRASTGEAGELGIVGETVDRDGLVAVASPVVLPAGVVAALDRLPSTDFAELVAVLGERFEVRTVEAPPSARRVASLDDVAVLEALTGPELDRLGRPI